MSNIKSSSIIRNGSFWIAIVVTSLCVPLFYFSVAPIEQWKSDYKASPVVDVQILGKVLTGKHLGGSLELCYGDVGNVRYMITTYYTLTSGAIGPCPYDVGETVLVKLIPDSNYALVMEDKK